MAAGAVCAALPHKERARQLCGASRALGRETLEKQRRPASRERRQRRQAAQPAARYLSVVALARRVVAALAEVGNLRQPVAAVAAAKAAGAAGYVRGQAGCGKSQGGVELVVMAAGGGPRRKQQRKGHRGPCACAWRPPRPGEGKDREGGWPHPCVSVLATHAAPRSSQSRGRARSGPRHLGGRFRGQSSLCC